MSVLSAVMTNRFITYCTIFAITYVHLLVVTNGLLSSHFLHVAVLPSLPLSPLSLFLSLSPSPSFPLSLSLPLLLSPFLLFISSYKALLPSLPLPPLSLFLSLFPSLSSLPLPLPLSPFLLFISPYKALARMKPVLGPA